MFHGAISDCFASYFATYHNESSGAKTNCEGEKPPNDNAAHVANYVTNAGARKWKTLSRALQTSAIHRMKKNS
jgi:hypothetical protein